MASKYWIESIESCVGEIGIELTDEQIKYIAESVETSHELYGMAHGHDVICSYSESNAERELRELKNKIKKEEEWERLTKPCEDCHTAGSVLDCCGRPTRCLSCDGKGRI